VSLSSVNGLKVTGRLSLQNGDQAAAAADSPCDLSSSLVTLVGEEEGKADPAMMIVL
jgi:hypothetical protein